MGGDACPHAACYGLPHHLHRSLQRLQTRPAWPRRSRLPALYLAHNGRSQGRHADAREPTWRSGGGVRLGGPWSQRCHPWRAPAVSCAVADGEFAAAAGRWSPSRVSFDAEHNRTPARAARKEDHRVRGRAAIFLSDPRPHLQRSGATRSLSTVRVQANDAPHRTLPQARRESRTYALPPRSRSVWRADAVSGDGRLAIRSVGKPLKGVEAKIVDAQPSDDDAPPSGEIVMRGPIVMKGYWNRPDATAEVLKDGWLYTGDLGYFDSEGNLFITGRKKDVIILSNGKNVYPEEIEAHYLQSPYIKEICVMGMEGTAGSDKLYAVVVPNFDVLRQRKVVNAKEVIRFDVEGLSAKLSSTKRVSGYTIWQEDLPRTTTRKLKRFEIQKRVQSGKGTEGGGELPATTPLTPEETAWLDQADTQ